MPGCLLLTVADEVNDPSCFCRVRDWIDKYLKYASDLKPSTNVIKYRDVWIQFPELVWALSRRRYALFSTRADTSITNRSSRFFGQF